MVGDKLASATAQRPPTLAEVAAIAGVSLKTASRAMNGEPRVAVQTRTKVLEAARSVGFRMNAMASQLARGVASNVIALITGDLANPFYSRLAQGVEREMRLHGLHLSIASSDEDAEAELALLQDLAVRQVRGVLLSSTMQSHEELHEIQLRGIPLVFVDRAPVGLEADSFVLDNYGGARTAIEHLLAAGHRRIAYVGDYARLQPQRERRQGFADALTLAGITGWQAFVEEGAHDIDSAYRQVSALLRSSPPPTAVFAANNCITIGALKAIAESAPGTALVGFDDFDLADVIGVTTISHDPAEMGRLAARRLGELTNGRTRDTHHVVLKTRLIARGSGERPPSG